MRVNMSCADRGVRAFQALNQVPNWRLTVVDSEMGQLKKKKEEGPFPLEISIHKIISQLAKQIILKIGRAHV